MFELSRVEKYDEELFTILFGVTNKIEIKKICIKFYWSLSYEDQKYICAKIYRKIRSLEKQNVVSNDVSCFINFFNLSNKVCL